jgi:transcription elongation GreA/GreB family factor
MSSPKSSAKNSPKNLSAKVPDKSRCYECVIAELKREQETLLRAAQEAYEGATHAEVKQENKYDTRGLESSYLAFGQSKRAVEIGENMERIKMLMRQPPTQSTAIQFGDLVELKKEDETKHWYFLVPGAGGFTIEDQAIRIQVVSGNSPLGAELRGKEIGDEVKVQKNETIICTKI